MATRKRPSCDFAKETESAARSKKFTQASGVIGPPAVARKSQTASPRLALTASRRRRRRTNRDRYDISATPVKQSIPAILTDSSAQSSDINSPQLTVSRIVNNDMVKLRIDPGMHFSSIQLGPYEPLGAGGYGEVVRSTKHNVAVKRLDDPNCFRWELAMTLLLCNAARRPEVRLLRDHFIQVLAFSTVENSMVLEALQCDLRAYIRSAATDAPPSAWAAIVSQFRGLARALAFMNLECGIAHLDIKSVNILVDIDPTTRAPSRMVIADMSVAALNSNSVLNNCQIYCPTRDGVQGVMLINDEDLAHNRHDDNCIVAHGHMQPPETLIAYVNGTRYSGRTLMAEESLAIDLFALGQVLLELVLCAGVCRDSTYKISRYPNYQGYGSKMCHDYAMDVLAYRMILTDSLLLPESDVKQLAPPSGTPADIIALLQSPENGIRLGNHHVRYRNTLRPALLEFSVPRECKPALNFSIQLSHWDPSVRRSAAILVE